MSYNASKVIEEVSQENWPAARVRNIVKVFEEQRSLQWMLDAPAPKRMTREKGLEWLAATAGIPLVDLKLMRPVPFVQQYVLGTREHQSLIQAIRIVHGITARAMYSPEKDCASDYMIERARWWIASEENAPRAPAPAPAEVIAEAPAPAPAEVVPQVHHRRPDADPDADDHLFEPPPVPLPTLTEVAERLASLREQVDEHVADREREEQQRKDDRKALNRLSDRLVSSEMELGLIDDALDHMYAGQQSPANVVGRLAAIIARITQMDI
uniref:Uncharacterized protein n=1 Tax=viral metagenome TaxID=1070528 RepID=A0A6C0HKJ7_9ZZZZ